MYDVGRKPTKIHLFAQRICQIAFKDWGFPVEALSENGFEYLADESLQRFPEECDARFRKMAIGHVKVFQRNLFSDLLNSFEFEKELLNLKLFTEKIINY